MLSDFKMDPDLCGWLDYMTYWGAFQQELLSYFVQFLLLDTESLTP